MRKRSCIVFAAICALLGCQHPKEPPGEGLAEILAALDNQCLQLGDTVCAMSEENWVGVVLSQEELRSLERHRGQVQEELIRMIQAGGTAEHPPERHYKALGATYLLGHFNTRKAIPLLRDALLAERYFYGWEGPDYFQEESYLKDYQYPHHMALIRAIETISGKPLWKAVQLRPEERRSLEEEASNPEGYSSRWLLLKLTQPSDAR